MKKTPPKSSTARKAHHRAKVQAIASPTQSVTAPVLYLATALSDQAKVIVEQMATIAVLRTVAAPNAEALRADLQQLATAVSSLVTRVQELEARPAAPTRLYTPTDVQQALQDRDDAQRALDACAQVLRLSTDVTATEDGRAEIVRAVADLRRGHDECFEELQKTEKALAFAESNTDHAITLRSLRETRARLAELLQALDLPYDAATYTDAQHAHHVQAVRQLRDDRTAATELLTQATRENAALRAHGMTLRQQFAELLAALGMPYHPEHYTDGTHVVFVKMAAELRTAADLNTPHAPTAEVPS